MLSQPIARASAPSSARFALPRKVKHADYSHSRFQRSLSSEPSIKSPSASREGERNLEVAASAPPSVSCRLPMCQLAPPTIHASGRKPRTELRNYTIHEADVASPEKATPSVEARRHAQHRDPAVAPPSYSKREKRGTSNFAESSPQPCYRRDETL